MENCKKLNLNYEVCVKLTPFGKNILFDYYLKLGVTERVVRKRYNMKNNTIQIQMWELAHIFGPQLYNGATDHPFESSFIFIPEVNLE